MLAELDDWGILSSFCVPSMIDSLKVKVLFTT